ncbi:hypothetical protein JT739_08695 [Tepidanaerobacter sp. GT38]|uniref:hypothetical protein n=1 Tax=Tepidanaerobacter sp. GT38 TaxID=2722793 RepID=UPI001F418F27|nr:hypothetical protein [Tepidanaerobacter sp. GT38]MCG1012675.1 hypothetical protein [Tepidanaerobacter sp. GT38]
MDILSYIIFGALIGIFLTIVLIKYIQRWKLKKRLQKAKKSEYEAIKLMKKYGFEILDLQKKYAYTLYVDDKPHKVTVKADMIVKKGNKIYIAEVKSGDKVTSPRYTDTRRQLLEYYMVYRPSGLILVDMEKQKLRTVEYSILNHDKSEYFHRIISTSVLLIIGFIVGFLTRGG